MPGDVARLCAAVAARPIGTAFGSEEAERPGYCTYAYTYV